MPLTGLRGVLAYRDSGGSDDRAIDALSWGDLTFDPDGGEMGYTEQGAMVVVEERGVA